MGIKKKSRKSSISSVFPSDIVDISKFQIKEIVQVPYHGDYYKAIIKSGRRNEDSGIIEYFVHYNGWKSSWDHWAEEHIILKDNEETKKIKEALKQKKQKLLEEETNKKEQKRKENKKIGKEQIEKLKKQEVTKKYNKKENKQIIKEKPYEISNGLKRKNDEDHQNNTEVLLSGSKPKKRKNEEMNAETIEEALKIPNSLKYRLVDEFSFINNKMMVPLPRTYTVTKILEGWVESRKNSTLEDLEIVVQELKSFFNQALGTLLLYRFERSEYQNMKVTNSNMSDVYGPEHLLRFFSKLPELIVEIQPGNEEILGVFLHSMKDLIKYIEENETNFFDVEYEMASAEYVRLSQT